ncbi:MAG: holo-ACP synthase [Aggregatilineales bacterium]
MPVLRIGVDMIEVARVQRALARHGERFYARFFTPRERHICAEQPQRLAARFAAKEAAAKALGTGIGAVRWLDLEIDSDAQGRPILKLHAAAAQIAQQLQLTAWEVSLSHTETHAIAFVVALG